MDIHHNRLQDSNIRIKRDIRSVYIENGRTVERPDISFGNNGLHQELLMYFSGFWI